MIRAIIIDDEKHCITNLQHDLEQFCPDVEIVTTCDSGKAGIVAINSLKPDLVFLDIEMPLMDGFEMLNALDGARNFDLIFTTAYDQFILKALRLSAVDYLLKPIEPSQLTLAVARVKKHMERTITDDDRRVDILMKNISVAEEKQKLAFPSRNSYDFIEPSEILYCKADGAYTIILLSDGKTLTLSRTLGETEKLLPQSIFIRIHYSTIVNIMYVRQIKKGDGHYILMSNGDKLSVARSKKEDFLVKMGIR